MYNVRNLLSIILEDSFAWKKLLFRGEKDNEKDSSYDVQVCLELSPPALCHPASPSRMLDLQAYTTRLCSEDVIQHCYFFLKIYLFQFRCMWAFVCVCLCTYACLCLGIRRDWKSVSDPLELAYMCVGNWTITESALNWLATSPMLILFSFNIYFILK